MLKNFKEPMDPFVPLTYDYSSMAPDYSGTASPHQSSIILTVFFQVLDKGTSEQIIHIPIRLNFPMHVRPLPERTLLHLLPHVQAEEDDSTDTTCSLPTIKEDDLTSVTTTPDCRETRSGSIKKTLKNLPAEKKFICKICTLVRKKYTTCNNLSKHLITVHKLRKSECLQYIKFNYPESAVPNLPKGKVDKKRASDDPLPRSKRLLPPAP